MLEEFVSTHVSVVRYHVEEASCKNLKSTLMMKERKRRRKKRKRKKLTLAMRYIVTVGFRYLKKYKKI